AFVLLFLRINQSINRLALKNPDAPTVCQGFDGPACTWHGISAREDRRPNFPASAGTTRLAGRHVRDVSEKRLSTRLAPIAGVRFDAWWGGVSLKPNNQKSAYQHRTNEAHWIPREASRQPAKR